MPQALQTRQANLHRGRAALSQQRERLTEAYLAGAIPLADYERRRRDADNRVPALDRQQQELVQDSKRQNETAGLVAYAEAFCQRVREALAGADFDRKRALLERLVDRVIVTDGTVRSVISSRLARTVNANRFGDCVLTIEAAIGRCR